MRLIEPPSIYAGRGRHAIVAGASGSSNNQDDWGPPFLSCPTYLGTDDVMWPWKIDGR